MPYGDHTGPMGQGPMTGKSLGLCSGYDTPGCNKEFRGGMGKGFGFGRGRARSFVRARGFGRSFTGFNNAYPLQQTVSKNDEIKMLKLQAENLGKMQKDIEKRLNELEK